MDWACGKKGNAYKVLVGKHKGNRPLRRKDRITADLKSYGSKWTRLIWLWIVHVVGSCEHGNQLLGSIQYREYLG